MVEGIHLKLLPKMRPKQPHNFERGTRGKLVSDWNLVAPALPIEKSWEDVV